MTAYFSRIDAKLDLALGFVSRTGIYQYHPTLRYRRHPDRHRPLRMDPFNETMYVTGIGSQRLDRIDYPGIEIENRIGNVVAFWGEDHHARLDEALAILPTIAIPPRTVPGP